MCLNKNLYLFVEPLLSTGDISKRMNLLKIPSSFQVLLGCYGYYRIQSFQLFRAIYKHLLLLCRCLIFSLRFYSKERV